jgi:hypothetical protein
MYTQGFFDMFSICCLYKDREDPVRKEPVVDEALEHDAVADSEQLVIFDCSTKCSK